jgi:hypothetical protein
VSARYQVLVSDELAAREPAFPPGLRFTVPADLRVAGSRAGLPLTPVPGAHWQQVEDDDADPGLEGQRVELVFVLQDGRPVVAERRLAT